MAQTLAQDPPIKDLWEAVGENYEVGTLEEFKAYLADTTKRRKFFDEIIKPTYNVESYEQFETTYGLKKSLHSLWQKIQYWWAEEPQTEPTVSDSHIYR